MSPATRPPGRLAILRIVTAAIVCLPFAPASADEPRPPAPELTATTLEHGDIDLAELNGKVVLLEFWASWCRSCIAGLPALKALHERHADDDLAIVGISLDEDPKSARRAIAEHELEWPQICDGLGKESPVARSYQVRGTPRFVLIDRSGHVAANYVRPSELDTAVAALLGGDAQQGDEK